MKKRVLIIFAAMMLAILSLVSCGKGKETENTGKNDTTGTEELSKNQIFSKSSELYLIYDPDIDGGVISEIAGEYDYLRDELIKYAAVDSEAHAHEIVLGNTDRQISKDAIGKIDRIDKNSDDELVYLVYSDGASVALVWEDDDPAMASLALEHFIEKYIAAELTLSPGIVSSGCINVYDYYEEKDKKYQDEAWAAYEKKYGKEFSDAFRQLYAVYSPDCITWLANLYDPDICVCVDLYGLDECEGTKYCGTGGFYYSNSARDTMGYLPDVESTHQALNFLTSAGLDSSYLNIISYEMKKQIGDFVYALEEPNGYFYHPQWGIEFTDKQITRRARDLSWATGVLSVLGRTPKYTTASGVKGEDATPSAASLYPRLGESRVTAVSRAVALSDAYAAHLQDLDAFMEYLATKDLRNNSYGVGSELSSQCAQIKARDKQIGTPNDPTPLMSYLIEWLNAGQNPETGHWDYKKPGDVGYRDYHGTNGLLKISGVYSEAGVVMPYAREAAISAMADIVNPAEIGAVVDLYNTWFAIKNIINNLTECGGASGKAQAEEIRSELRAMAPEALLASRDKISAFLKEDGSASYLKNQSSPTSQGCPAAVPGTNEGDVNGATIAINGIIGNAAAALGVNKIKLFGDAEKYLFRKTVDNLSPITKAEGATAPEPITFDYEDVGVPSEELTYLGSEKGSANVIADPTGKSDGNVVEIVSYPGEGDTVKIPLNDIPTLAKANVFEGEFCINETSSDYSVQLTLDACYMITFRPVTDESDPDYGKIRLVESSSATGTVSIDEYLGITVEKGEWFSLKVIYYYGNEDEVRIKVYADTDLTDDEGQKLYAVSDNYRNEAGNKVIFGTATPTTAFYISQIYVMSGEKLSMYIDNVNCYKANETYSPVLAQGEKPYFNIDGEGEDERLYDFENGLIPEDIKVESDGSVKVDSDGRLAITGSDSINSLTIPVTVREAVAKCAVASFDIFVTDAQVGKEVMLLTGKDGKEAIFSLVLAGAEDNGEKYLTISPKKNTAEAPIEGVRIPYGRKVNLSFAYYHLEDIILIYIDGEFVGASTKLFDEGNRRTMDALEISTFASADCEIAIDDLRVEKLARLFTDAVAPSVEEKLYDFETDHEELEFSNVGISVQDHATDTALIMNSNGTKATYLTLPVNERANIVNSLIFSASFDYVTYPSSIGDTHKISFADEDGNQILAFILGYDGNTVGLYEVGKGGRTKTPLCTFAKGESVKLDFEIFGEKRMVHVLKNGATIAKSSIFLGEEYLEGGYKTAKIESLDARCIVAIDDVRCETLYKIYRKATPTGSQNPETDYKAGIDFESSNSGNLPSSLYVVNSGENYVAIRNDYNELTKEYSNIITLNKQGAGNDELSFVSKVDMSAANSTVFEADIRLDLTSAGCQYRVSFGTANRGDNAMYMLQLNRNSLNEIYIEDVSTSADNRLANRYETGVHGGEWFRLRVELYRGTRETVWFRVYVNGALIGESDNFVGKHNPDSTVQSLPSTVFFYCMGATRGVIDIDNVKIYASAATK